MDVRHETRGLGARRQARGASVRVEALEGRALLASGGAISAVAALPAGYTVGPMAVARDATLWFGETGRAGGPALGSLSATGAQKDVPLPAADAGDAVTAVAADAGGNVWYTLAATAQPADGSPAGKIGKVGPDGALTEYALGSPSETPGPATIGADGNLYVAVSGGAAGPAVAVVNVKDGTVSEHAVKGAGGPLTWLTKGPDGNLWFVDGKKIGKMTPSGVVTEFAVAPPTGSGLAVDLSNAQLTAGTDGDLWFLGLGGVNKITPAGVVTTTSAPGATVTGLTTGPDGNLWVALVPPAGSELALTPGEVVLRMSADGQVTPLPDHVATGGNVLRMSSGNGGVWLDEGGTAIARVNVASVATVTPAVISPTTPHPVTTDAHKTIAGPIVSFTANYEGALPGDFSATINYGDGYTGQGAIVVDPRGGFDVLGYNTYTSKAPGTQVKVTVDVTGKGGTVTEIYGVVVIASPPAPAVKPHVAPAKPHAPVKASHPKGPAAHHAVVRKK